MQAQLVAPAVKVPEGQSRPRLAGKTGLRPSHHAALPRQLGLPTLRLSSSTPQQAQAQARSLRPEQAFPMPRHCRR